MNDLATRLMALAEKAVDEALQLDYGDPDDRYIYRELQELRQLVQQQADGPTDPAVVTADWRAELQRLVEAYDNHGGKWPQDHEDGLFDAVKVARAALAKGG